MAIPKADGLMMMESKDTAGEGGRAFWNFEKQNIGDTHGRVWTFVSITPLKQLFLNLMC